MPYKIEHREFELPPEGIHEAVVYAWEDKGIVQTRFGDKHRAVIKYESLTHKMEDGRRFSIFDFLNIAFGPNATLTTRYRQITGKNLEGDNFDPNDLIGQKVQIYIIHNESEDGERTYANISKIKRCDDQDIPKLENEYKVTESPGEDPAGVNQPAGVAAGEGDLPF